MPLNAIIIEAHSMCPNCRQRVNREIEDVYWYRRKWLRFVKSVSQKNGWEYRAGQFEPTPWISTARHHHRPAFAHVSLECWASNELILRPELAGRHL
jgi:hypothetical protein